MASSALAQHPDMTETLTAVTRLLVLLFLVSSMSGIGLGLTLSQIIAPLRNVRLIVLAVIVNFIVVPLLAVGLARLLRLDEPFALGLLLLGLAAGAPFLPKVVSIANGDVASAVGLMVLLMVGTTVFLPVALPLLIKGVQVNPWKIARFLTLLMLIPLVAGLIVRARAASIGERARPVFEGLSTGVLLLVLVLVMAVHFQGVLRIFGTGAIFAALLFAILAAAAGWLIGGADLAQRTVLGLGTGLRNIPAALVVSVQDFKDPNVSVMVLVTTLIGILILLPAARLIGRRQVGALSESKAIDSN
jgi:BASS family bile acid:Na+ symporter